MGSPSIDDEVLIGKSNVKLLGDDGPPQMSILETLNEASESPQTKEPDVSLAAAQPAPTPAITISVSQEPPPPQEKESQEETKATEQSEAASATANASSTAASNGDSPQLGAEGVVRRTGSSSEKKKSRRIRTKSQVETII